MADTLTITWEGHDGSSWDLLDPLSPVFAVSIAGMGLPGFTQQWTKSSARDGQRYEGTTWDENSVILTVQVGDTYPLDGRRTRRTGDEWRALDRSFRKAFSAEEEGRLVVTSGVGTRYLGLRLDSPFPIPPDANPALLGQAVYVIGLTAGDEPWWVGDEITAVFGWSNDDHPFFSEDGAPGEVGIYVAKDAELESAQLHNPGDREAWPLWWAQGPAGEVHVGVGDDYVILPFAVAEDQRVYVDSRNQTITDEAGTNLWPLMGFSDATFPALPAQDQVALYTSLINAGEGASIGITIVPRYDGPW